MDDWCFAWFEDAAGPGRDRQALATRSKWGFGDTITIGFLDGSRALQDRVTRIAGEWLSRTGANLHFSILDDAAAAAVRISFNGRGQWSAIGTDCKRIAAGQPTLNLGDLNATSPDGLVRRKTLHELGHVLGMVHEHQIPDAPIEWDRDAVYADVGRGGWSPAKIDDNLLTPIARGECNAVAFDPASIMIYPIKASWTKNRFASTYNLDLSAGDVAFIKAQYGS